MKNSKAFKMFNEIFTKYGFILNEVYRTHYGKIKINFDYDYGHGDEMGQYVSLSFENYPFGNKPHFEIHWSSLGTQSVDCAEAFAKTMLSMVECAKEANELLNKLDINDYYLL